MPLARILSRIWFGPGSGVGTSRSTQALLADGTIAARMEFLPGRGQEARRRVILSWRHPPGGESSRPGCNLSFHGAAPIIAGFPSLARRANGRGFHLGA